MGQAIKLQYHNHSYISRPDNGLPGAEELEDLGLEETDNAFGEGIVTGISYTADRSVDASLSSRPVYRIDRYWLLRSL